MRAIAQLRRLPRRARLAQAQGAEARAARGARPPASPSSMSPARDLTEAHLGRLLRLLSGHRLAQMGPALSQPALLLAGRRDDGRAHPADHVPSAPAATSPARSISSAATRSMAAIGAASRIIPSCISSSATIRPSTIAIAHGLRASRPARRASTSWRAAIARSSPARPLTSPIRGLRRAVADYLRQRTCAHRERAGDACGGTSRGDSFLQCWRATTGCVACRTGRRHDRLRSLECLRQDPARRAALA